MSKETQTANAGLNFLEIIELGEKGIKCKKGKEIKNIREYLGDCIEIKLNKTNKDIER